MLHVRLFSYRAPPLKKVSTPDKNQSYKGRRDVGPKTNQQAYKYPFTTNVTVHINNDRMTDTPSCYTASNMHVPNHSYTCRDRVYGRSMPAARKLGGSYFSWHCINAISELMETDAEGSGDVATATFNRRPTRTMTRQQMYYRPVRECQRRAR